MQYMFVLHISVLTKSDDDDEACIYIKSWPASNFFNRPLNYLSIFDQLLFIPKIFSVVPRVAPVIALI
jgi:hypothetical protein